MHTTSAGWRSQKQTLLRSQQAPWRPRSRRRLMLSQQGSGSEAVEHRVPAPWHLVLSRVRLATTQVLKFGLYEFSPDEGQPPEHRKLKPGSEVGCLWCCGTMRTSHILACCRNSGEWHRHEQSYGMLSISETAGAGAAQNLSACCIFPLLCFPAAAGVVHGGGPKADQAAGGAGSPHAHEAGRRAPAPGGGAPLSPVESGPVMGLQCGGNAHFGEAPEWGKAPCLAEASIPEQTDVSVWDGNHMVTSTLTQSQVITLTGCQLGSSIAFRCRCRVRTVAGARVPAGRGRRGGGPPQVHQPAGALLYVADKGNRGSLPSGITTQGDRPKFAGYRVR